MAELGSLHSFHVLLCSSQLCLWLSWPYDEVLANKMWAEVIFDISTLLRVVIFKFQVISILVLNNHPRQPSGLSKVTLKDQMFQMV